MTNASVDAFSANARGSARIVYDDGTPVTPAAETWLMSTHSNDFTPLERHAGWILVGDFVLYNDGTTVYLWIGPEDRRALCKASTHFQWDHSDGILGIRLWTTAEMLASTVSWEAEREQAEAVGPAARVFVDGCGWRWLFPHADGPAGALAHLRSTSALDDLQQLSRLLPAAPPHERKLAERHFRCLVHGAARDASDRALDLTRISDRSRVDAALLERLEAVFAKPAVEALDLTVTGWRRASQGSDEWTLTPVSLADALAGRHEGRPGVRVVVRPLGAAPGLLQRLGQGLGAPWGRAVGPPGAAGAAQAHHSWGGAGHDAGAPRRTRRGGARLRGVEGGAAYARGDLHDEAAPAAVVACGAGCRPAAHR